MSVYFYIFISCVSVSLLITAIVSIIVQVKKNKQLKLYFNPQTMSSYEDKVKKYLIGSDIKGFCTIEEICDKIGKKIEKTDSLSSNREAYIDSDRPNIILVNKNLSLKQMNFAIAHELAHIINESKLPVGRDAHSYFFRAKEEQICDYIAAAILLPVEFMMTKMQDACFESLSRKDRVIFAKLISDEVNVEEEVVIRRICEIKKLIRT